VLAMNPADHDEVTDLGPLELRMTIPQGVIVMHPLAQLRKHRAYAELDLAASPAQLAEIQSLGDRAFKDPILITAEGIIIAGYARRELAEKQGISTLFCVELVSMKTKRCGGC
jgi:hypothetical protein